MSKIFVDQVDPKTATTLTLGTSGDTVSIPSGVTIANAGTATGFGITATSFRPNVNPIIINGNMAVAQRGTSQTGVTNGNYGIYTCDRINFNESGTMSAVIDITQESLTSGNAYTDGFSNAYKIDVTTADGSLAADDFYRTNYRIEGQDLQLFKKGTANAEKFTLAFWAKATKTGTNIVELADSDNGRHCCASYTIDTTNTWEHKVLNFPADTTGIWGNDNAQSLRINFVLGAGSNYTSGTLATSWATTSNANLAVGQVNNFDSTSNNVHITGIQLEVGEYTSATIPPFQHETYGDNLQRCSRYFVYTGGGSAYQSHGTGVEVSATAAYNTIPLTCPMRASPSYTGRNISSLKIYDGTGEHTMTSIGSVNYSPNTSLLNSAVNCSGGGLTDGNGAVVYSSNDSDSGFLISAEL